LDGTFQFLSFLLLDKLRPRFGSEDSDIPPISTITSQGRHAALLEDNTTKNPLTKADTEQPNHQKYPFSDEGISKAPKKFISAISKPPGPPSDDSALSLNLSQLSHPFLPDLINDLPLSPVQLMLNQSIITLI
jgi:hypothetical protein